MPLSSAQFVLIVRATFTMEKGSSMLSKQFFFGGNATFTVENGKGAHYTFKVRQPKAKKKGDIPPFFVSLMTGTDNESHFSYMGILLPDGKVRATTKSKVTPDSVPFKVAEWAMGRCFNAQALPAGYKVRHNEKCARCGRKLTTPESLDRGIGPECWQKRNGM
jgi:hypothetical protein